MNKAAIDKAIRFLEVLRAYHRHEVIGIEHVPKDGGCVLVSNHSLATYDFALLMSEIYKRVNRLPRPLVDRLFFKIPYLGELMHLLGAEEGSRKSAMALLRKKNLITVAPGGMREALRPSSQRYQIRWARRKGFVRMAIETGSTIVLAACPKADDMYDIVKNPVTPWFYKKFKIPVFLATGLGPTPIPKPVKLTHFISEPLAPRKMSAKDPEFENYVDEFHQLVLEKMRALIDQAIHFRR